MPLCYSPSPTTTHHTLRFSGAQHHHYLLDFLQSVAECYYRDGRAGDLVVDLLKLRVPKLFAVEWGREEDEAVRHMFSAFLRGYISRCAINHTILEKMDIVVVSVGLERLAYIGQQVNCNYKLLGFFCQLL